MLNQVMFGGGRGSVGKSTDTLYLSRSTNITVRKYSSTVRKY